MAGLTPHPATVAGEPGALPPGGSRARGKAMTIGAVCKALAQEFPDISISKIRYLEDQKLITPRRTPGGYRLYSAGEVQRLRTILRLQRDEFLPLRVIRQELAAGAGAEEEPVPRGESGADAAEAEHANVASLSAELMGADDRHFATLFTQLTEAVLAHAGEEERTLLPALRGAVGAKRMSELGHEALAWRRSGPRRALAPDPVPVLSTQGA